MQLTYLHIHNFKSIRSMEIRDIERALILVGKNNTGKTSVLDAICAVCGCYEIQDRDFNENRQAIRIDACFSIEEEDLHLFHHMGIVSQYRRYDVWRRVFSERLPSWIGQRQGQGIGLPLCDGVAGETAGVHPATARAHGDLQPVCGCHREVLSGAEHTAGEARKVGRHVCGIEVVAVGGV